MTEPVDMKRPPLSGPGSGVEQQRAYAAKLTGRPLEDFANMQRDEVIEFIDTYSAEDPPREAPDGVKPTEKPRHKDAKGRPTWSVPVEGGYVPEHELVKAEREQVKAEQAKAKARQG
jgi:hypothetical protein